MRPNRKAFVHPSKVRVTFQKYSDFVSLAYRIVTQASHAACGWYLLSTFILLSMFMGIDNISTSHLRKMCNFSILTCLLSLSDQSFLIFVYLQVTLAAEVWSAWKWSVPVAPVGEICCFDPATVNLCNQGGRKARKGGIERWWQQKRKTANQKLHLWCSPSVAEKKASDPFLIAQLIVS